MKLLIAVFSCEAYEVKGNNNALRNTWLSDASKLGIDYKFFHGIGAQQKEDVVMLPCNDGYGGLLQKDKWAHTWCLEHDYDFMYHCDHDTYARPERLIDSGFEKYDLAGCLGPLHSIEGGPGYFVSRKACQIHVNEIEEACKGHVIQGKHSCTDYNNSFLQDWWLSALVADHNLPRAGSKSMVHLWSTNDIGPRKDNNIMSAHLSTMTPPNYVNVGGREQEHRYQPWFMVKKHQEWLDSTGNGWIGANFTSFS